MKKSCWIAIALITTACGAGIKIPTTPAPPDKPVVTTPAAVAADMVACEKPPADNYCPGPAGALFRVHVKINPDVYLEEHGDGNGYVYAQDVPAGLGPIDITISAPGFDTRVVNTTLPALVAENLAGRHNFFVLQSSHVDPASFTEAQIRAVRADLSGVYIDAIKPQCPVDPQTGISCTADNGATPRGLVDGALFTANYRIYTAAQRQIIRDTLTGQVPDSKGITHHYTHMAISLFCRDIPDYHGVYPPCSSAAKVGVNDALQELWDARLIPIGFAMHDDEPNDLTTPLSVGGVVDPRLVRMIVPYWEHFEVTCATLKVHQAFPDALVYYHNPTSTDAPYGDACYGSGVYPGAGAVYGWLQAHLDGKFAGLMLQTAEEGVADLTGRIADFTASFSFGPRIGRVGGGWPSGLDTVHFEDIVSTYNNFWGGGNEQQILERLNQINVFVTTPLCEDVNTRAVVSGGQWCGTLAGFGSGGSVR